MLFSDIIPLYLTDYYIYRLLIASLLGAIIGIERDMHGRAAGLRTNMLVSLGSALFMIISESIVTSYGVNGTSEIILKGDPGRIAAQIVTGIGFIGAGSIIKFGFSIKGLTTAACLWVSAGIGMSAGAGLYELSIITTVFGILGLIIFHYIEKIIPTDSYRLLEIVTTNNEKISILMDTIKKQKRLKVLHLDSERDYLNNKMTLKFHLKLFHLGLTDKISHDIVENIEKLEISIHKIKWYHL